jgi:hypothetical protein
VLMTGVRGRKNSPALSAHLRCGSGPGPTKLRTPNM